MSKAIEKIDAAFNDLRRKVDYIEESCRWQNAVMKKILQTLEEETRSTRKGETKE